MAVKVKICGLTRAGDAEDAVRSGAGYLGIVFAQSPRTVSPEIAKTIVRSAGAVPVLGVFGEQDVSEILRTCVNLGLRGAQLQSPYPTDVARRLRDADLMVWRVGRLKGATDLNWLPALREASTAILIEASVPHALGGTGVPLPLELARQARARLPGHQLVLAGGLTSENVAPAIATVDPDVVDVSSGVEVRPGIKDPIRIMQFMEAVVGHQSSR